MTGSAPTAGTSSQIDRQIGELVASEPEAGFTKDGTSAGAMSPLEAAVLVLSLDLRNVLRFAGELKRQGGELKRQGETLGSFARLQAGRHGKREDRHPTLR